MTDARRIDVASRLRSIVETGRCTYAEFARVIHAANQQMARHVAEGLVADPARSILLEVFIAKEEQQVCSVKRASLASDAPPSTALRYIGRLKRDGLLTSELDNVDRRRVLLDMTPEGRGRVAGYLRSIAPCELV